MTMHHSARLHGRKARAEPSSRKGQYYDSPIEPVFSTSLGNLTECDYRAKLDRMDPVKRFSMVRNNDLVDSKFSRKSCVCGGKIKIQSDGKAICNNPHCSTVFNDGGNTEGMIQVTDHYDSGKTEVTIHVDPPPRNPDKDFMRGMHKFQKACRA
jgi:hypothetical protein